MITEQEKDAALTVLADYIAQNDINMVGGAFENDVMGEFVVTYGKESALQDIAKDKAELVGVLNILHQRLIKEGKRYGATAQRKAVSELLEKHK